MASTHGWVLHDALHAFEESGIDYAILHGEPPGRSATGQLSDVDVVAALDQGTERNWLETLQSKGIFCIQKVRYDVGSISYFLMTENGRGGQFDVILDSSGINRYGLRATVALARAFRRDRWIRVTPEDELLYLVIKRWWKRDSARVDELRLRAQPDGAALVARAGQLFAKRFHRPLADMLQMDRRPAFPRRGLSPAVVARAYCRLVQPAGWWWHHHGQEDKVYAVAEVLGRTLVSSRVYTTTGPSAPSALMLRCTIRRPGAVATAGRVPRPMRPDFYAYGDDSDSLLADVVRRAADLVQWKRSL